VHVEAYGSKMPMNQVAALSVPEPTLIVAQPFDPALLAALERAIRLSDLGLNPSSDGKVIRIPIPPLTEDRRKDLVKKAHDFAEHARNAVRQARREGNDLIKAKEKKHDISQDDERRGHDEVQRLHDHYIAQINQTLQHKEKDILTL
jgi:ribosome recycling factor